MLALSTQALSGDTDLQATMKSAVQFFITTLAAAMGLTMVGCGGGGGEPVYSEPTGTARLVSADSRIMSPKLMTVSGADIYVANQNNSDANGVLKINVSDLLTTAGFLGLTDAIGIATNSTGTVYVAGKYYATPRISSLTPTAITLSIGSHYGFIFDVNLNLYAADVSTTAGRAPSIALSTGPSYSSWRGSFSAETPKAFAYKNGFIYFTTDEGNIFKLPENTSVPTQLNLSGPPLNKPNGIAFDGDVMYVVNYGPPAGTGSWIAKITNETTVTEFKKDINWLCASAGIAVRDNYIYVSNGTPATPGSCGTIPGTNTSIQNTIVKFFH